MSRTALTSQRYGGIPESDDAQRLRAAAARRAPLDPAEFEEKKPKRVVEIDAPAQMDASAGFMIGVGLGWVAGMLMLVIPGLRTLFEGAGPLAAGLYGAGVGAAIGLVLGGTVQAFRAPAAQPAKKTPSGRALSSRKRGALAHTRIPGLSQAARLSEIRLGMAHDSLQNSLNEFAGGTGLPTPAYVKVPSAIAAQIAVHRAQTMPFVPLSIVSRPYYLGASKSRGAGSTGSSSSATARRSQQAA